MNKMKVASIAVAMTVLGLGLAACGNQICLKKVY